MKAFAANLVACLAVLSPALPAQAAQPAQRMHIGIVALDSAEAEDAYWQPVEADLQQQLGDVDVTIDVYGYDDLEHQVLRRNVDAIIASPAEYLHMAARVGLSSPLASLLTYDHGKIVPGFGGAIIVRVGPSEPGTLRDLKGRRIAAGDRRATNDYVAQAYELFKAGVSMPGGVRLVAGGTNADNARALLEHRVDAVFARGGELERLERVGAVRAGTLRVLQPRDLPGYPFAISTPLYPGWAVAVLPQVDAVLTNRLVAALLQVRPVRQDLVARGSIGFATPQNYEPVRAMMHRLRLPPYDQEPEITLADLWRDHPATIAALVVASVAVIVLLLVSLVSLVRLRRSREEARRSALRAEEERERLRQSEERFRHLFHDTRQAISLIIDGRFVDANRASLEMLGLQSVEQIRGCTPMDISPERQPDGRLSAEKAADLIHRTEQDGSQQFDWVHRRVNGEEFWAHVMLTVLELDGRPALHVVWTDVTEARRAAAELERYRANLEQLVTQRTAALEAASAQVRASEERFELAFAASEDGIWDWDMSSNTVYCSPSYYRMLGFEPGELAGSRQASWIDLLHPDEREAVLASVAAALGTGTYDGEFRMRCKDGSYRWIHARGQVSARDAGGRPARAVGTNTDLTVRKELEIELRRAKEQAEAANNAKSTFLANVSHEIRTPMNAIVGFAHLLQRDLKDPGHLDKLRKINSSAQHLLSILNDVLDLSKIEAGRLVMEDASFSAGAMLEDVHSMMSERAAAKQLDFRVEVDPRLADARFRGDPLRLRQVLVNLLSNALKFTEHGGVTVSGKVLAEDDGIAALRFEVRDTGIGMTEEQQQRAFVAFEQAEASTTRRFGGTGLGLAISRRLVEHMGGQIGVVSAPGSGSTFWFTVPLPRSFEEPVHAPGADRVWLRAGAKVLLAEDNPINQQVAVEILQRFGLDVEVAADGLQACEKFAAGSYDLVLMDLQMPVMDGFEATRRIRTLQSGRAVPIVAMTANAFDEDRHRCLEAGMNGHVSKPVDIDQLRATLGIWLADEQGRPASSGAPPDAGEQPATAVQIDLATGLQRCGGDRNVYRRILNRFVDLHGGDGARLEAALAADDRVAAKPIVHTLKGVAGTIGALGLQDAALRLEQRITGGTQGVELTTAIAEVKERLALTCAEVLTLPQGGDTA